MKKRRCSHCTKKKPITDFGFVPHTPNYSRETTKDILKRRKVCKRCDQYRENAKKKKWEEDPELMLNRAMQQLDYWRKKDSNNDF